MQNISFIQDLMKSAMHNCNMSIYMPSSIYENCSFNASFHVGKKIHFTVTYNNEMKFGCLYLLIEGKLPKEMSESDYAWMIEDFWTITEEEWFMRSTMNDNYILDFDFFELFREYLKTLE